MAEEVDKPIERYGLAFPSSMSLLDIELWCYRHDPRPENTGGRLMRYDHAVNAANYLWNRKESSFKIVWNSITEQILYECIYNRYLGIAGCASSTKSFGAGLFGLLEYLSWPSATLVMMTSTTKDAAGLRCWKGIAQLWGAIEKLGMPGKHVPSKKLIRGVDVDGQFVDFLGLRVVAAGKGKEKAAVDDIQGVKAENLILLADELPKLSKAITNTAFTNLDSNQNFQMKALGNPELKNDAFGDFCRPVGGWNSVDESNYSWKTQHGKVIRFDARKTPRLTEEDGDEKYPFFPSRSSIEMNKEKYGENSRQFWSMVVGMWPREGLIDTIFSETELEPCMAKVDPKEWDSPPLQKALALDAAYSSQGDVSPIGWAQFGTIKGVKVMELIDYKNAKEDVKDSNEISAQILMDFKETAESLKIEPRFCGYDSTGWGTVLKHFTNFLWSTSVRAIQFEGKPVERFISVDKLATEEFDRRVSQLWGQMKPLVRRGQIRGLTVDVVEEMVNRMWDKKKSGRVLAVESKIDMRKRIGKSPDLADMVAILVEVGILNGLLDIQETREVRTRNLSNFKESIRRPGINGRRKFSTCYSTKKLKYR